MRRISLAPSTKRPVCEGYGARSFWPTGRGQMLDLCGVVLLLARDARIAVDHASILKGNFITGETLAKSSVMICC